MNGISNTITFRREKKKIEEEGLKPKRKEKGRRDKRWDKKLNLRRRTFRISNLRIRIWKIG